MKKCVDEFFSALHRSHLKPRGFKKVNRTFSRDLGSHWERINIQGSCWNSGNSNDPWVFFVNVGIEFKDLPQTNAFVYVRHTHWATRIEGIVSAAPNQYELQPNHENIELGDQLIAHIESASKYIAAQYETIYHDYIKHRDKTSGK